MSAPLLTLVKYYCAEKDLFILRVSRDTLRMVWAAMTLLRSIEKVEITMRVLQVFGKNTALKMPI